jgi:predicted CoA-binding protein
MTRDDGEDGPLPAGRRPASRSSADDLERARAFVDLHEGRGPVPVLDDESIRAVLRSARRIAVVGASSRPGRPSLGVFETLVRAGYDCVPVNPNETTVAGVPAYTTLTEAAVTGPFDIVDVFRRADFCTDHAREAVAIGAGVLWLQLGIVSWEAAAIAHEAGLGVVMDRCTAIELRRLG